MKQAVGAVFQAFEFDAANSIPLYQQLYRLLREALISGAIPPGRRLPSTRSLAEDLSLSRNTVSAAFERLVDEGFIDSRVGDGSYASPTLAEESYLERPVRPAEAPVGSAGVPSQASTEGRRLSRRGTLIASTTVAWESRRPRAFSLGVPSLEEFPLATWQRILARRARQTSAAELAHGTPTGDERLRGLIAQHLTTARGVRCSPEQLLILPSAQFGLDLVSRLLLDPGDPVWMEEPGYLGARGALLAAGAELTPVPVDEEGLDVEAGRRALPEARLAYVTPSHQFPLGGTMSLRRRLQLLAWAEEVGAWVLEDDYDSEYRYSGAAAQALQGLDRSGRVLYLGTFSKVLFPGIRVAYLLVPDGLVDAFLKARFLADGHAPLGVQLALADFIEAGHMAGHLRRMRSLYRERRDLLLHEAGRRFGERLEFAGADAGLHVSGQLSEGEDRPLVEAGARVGLDLPPLSRYYFGPTPGQGITFGYAHVSSSEIVRGCELLDAVFDEVS